jgi:hypothetical protein
VDKMEKLEKEEDISDQLDTLRNYGFNIDELIDSLNEDNDGE